MNHSEIRFFEQVHFWNHETNCNGWADFVFHELKLIIELDGTHHLKRAEKDAIHDEYLLRDRGYTTLHITQKEYVKKMKLADIERLLAPPP